LGVVLATVVGKAVSSPCQD
jgi:hypothetical protein